MNYETHDLELLVIMRVFKHWRHYLKNSSQLIQMLTDHANLRYFFMTKKLNQQQTCWAEKLVAFDFYIEYRAGKKNPANDLLRHSDYSPAEDSQIELLPTLQRKLVQD